MTVSKFQNTELLTLQQACECTSLGRTKLREVAKAAQAERKIGKSYRIKKSVLLDYIEENCKVE